jgi:hypothetical protein
MRRSARDPGHTMTVVCTLSEAEPDSQFLPRWPLEPATSRTADPRSAAFTAYEIIKASNPLFRAISYRIAKHSLLKIGRTLHDL